MNHVFVHNTDFVKNFKGILINQKNCDEQYINDFKSLMTGDIVLLVEDNKIMYIGEISEPPNYHRVNDYTWKLLNISKKNKLDIVLDDKLYIAYIDKWFELDKYVEYNGELGLLNIQENQDLINNLEYEYIIKKNKSNIKEIVNLLKYKRQIILQGPPGTGKTYTSAEIAVCAIDGELPDNREAIMKRYKELSDNNQIFFITFHQSMDYEDFVEGFKADISESGNLVYSLKDGIFKQACKNAEAIDHNNEKVVLIIDEINRGNISKIFGELITLLENDKRKGNENEIEAILPYSKTKLSIPNHLFIIGTMNTIDRSVDYIDYAIRRRFLFITLKSDKEKIKIFNRSYKSTKMEYYCLELFNNIENIIKENLDDHFNFDDIMIGHSYFICTTKERLQIKLEYEIKPLLLEYIKDGILHDSKILREKIEKLIIK